MSRRTGGQKFTPLGYFDEDPGGLLHYTCNPGVTLLDAARDALENRPEGPCWFWFNDTPASMDYGDTAHDLAHRWQSWRTGYAVYLVDRLRERVLDTIPF